MRMLVEPDVRSSKVMVDVSDATRPFADDLVAVGRRHDREAFCRVFEYFGPRVKTYLRKLGLDDDSAEDLTQDVMVTIWRRAGQYDPEKAAASTWVYAIARNKRIDLFRRNRAADGDLSDPSLEPPSPTTGFEVVATEQMEARIRQAIGQLPENQSELLRVFYFEDKTHVTIAEETGLPLGTVKSRLRLAMDKLRALVGNDLA